MLALLLALALQEGPMVTAPPEAAEPSAETATTLAEPVLAPAVLNLVPVAAAGTPVEVTSADAAATVTATAIVPEVPVLPHTRPYRPESRDPESRIPLDTPAATASAQGGYVAPARPPVDYARPSRPDLRDPESRIPLDPPAATPAAPMRYADYAASADASFDASIRGRALSAERNRGPMQGGWVLSSRAGERLFAFELLDEGYGTLDGAWTALGGSIRSGFLALASRTTDSLTLRWIERPGARPNVLEVERTSDPSVWTGRLDRDGDVADVQLRAR